MQIPLSGPRANPKPEPLETALQRLFLQRLPFRVTVFPGELLQILANDRG
jgi:hypothetical protein